MKNPKFRETHKEREQTTNYAPDKHKKFCERCFLHNGGCINTKSKKIDPNCNL